MVVLVTLIGLFIGIGISTVYRSAFGEVERSDFGVYHAAGRAVLDGTPLYEAVNSRGWYYMYLPPFAILMVPLSLLPRAAASTIFYILSVGMLLHMIRLSVRLAEARAGPLPLPRFGVWLLVFSATGWMWMSGLGRGQASVMLSWLTIAGVAWCLRAEAPQNRHPRGWRWVGGLALAGATVIRIFPILFGLWLLGRRRWKSAAVALICLIAVGLGFPLVAYAPAEQARLLETWYTTVAHPTGDAAAEHNRRYDQMMDPRIEKNQSAQASLIRIFAPREEAGGADHGERVARLLALGLTIALIGFTTLATALASRRAVDGRVGLLSAAAFAVVSLLAPPVTWVHNFSLMALPVAVVIARVTTTGGAVRGLYQIACIAWIASSMIGLAPPLYRAGGVTWGALLVWLALVVDLAVPTTRTAHAQASAASSTLSGPNMRSC